MAARKPSLEETQPALENVGPGVRDYAGAQIAPPSHQSAIKNTQRHDYHHLLPTLIRAVSYTHLRVSGLRAQGRGLYIGTENAAWPGRLLNLDRKLQFRSLRSGVSGPS